MRVLHGAPLFKPKVQVYGAQHRGNKIAVGGNSRTFIIAVRNFFEGPQGAVFGDIERLAAISCACFLPSSVSEPSGC